MEEMRRFKWEHRAFYNLHRRIQITNTLFTPLPLIIIHNLASSLPAHHLRADVVMGIRWRSYRYLPYPPSTQPVSRKQNIPGWVMLKQENRRKADVEDEIVLGIYDTCSYMQSVLIHWYVALQSAVILGLYGLDLIFSLWGKAKAKKRGYGSEDTRQSQLEEQTNYSYTQRHYYVVG